MNLTSPSIVFKETKSVQGALSLDLAMVVGDAGLLLGYWVPAVKVGSTVVEASQIRVRLPDGRSAEAKILRAKPELNVALFQAPWDGLSQVTLREEPVRVGEPVTVLTAVRDKVGAPQIVERNGVVTALYPRGWEGRKAWQIELSAPLKGGIGPVLDATQQVVGMMMGDRRPPDKRHGTGLPYRSYAISVGLLRPFLENATGAQHPASGQAL
jgi:S1-C subfamily serine protease